MHQSIQDFSVILFATKQLLLEHIKGANKLNKLDILSRTWHNIDRQKKNIT